MWRNIKNGTKRCEGMLRDVNHKTKLNRIGHGLRKTTHIQIVGWFQIHSVPRIPMLQTSRSSYVYIVRWTSQSWALCTNPIISIQDWVSQFGIIDYTAHNNSLIFLDSRTMRSLIHNTQQLNTYNKIMIRSWTRSKRKPICSTQGQILSDTTRRSASGKISSRQISV